MLACLLACATLLLQTEPGGVALHATQAASVTTSAIAPASTPASTEPAATRAARASRSTQAPQAQDPQALADYVTQLLREHTTATHGDALHVTIAPVRPGLPACNTWAATPPRTLRARTNVAVRCLAPQPWHVTVTAHLRLPGTAWMAARTIASGETLGPDDLRGTAADLLQLPADTITDRTQAEGRIATQRIRKGSPLKSGSLRAPASIQRGQRVHTQAHGAGFVVRGAGFALQSGAHGSVIQVRTASGQVVSGIVVDANTVQMTL